MHLKDPIKDARRQKKNLEWAKKYRKTPEYKAAFETYRASEKYLRTRRSTWYKNKYHITFEEFEAQIARQNGLCPIGNHPFGPLGKGGDSPCLDHDHETGTNREILCSNHNVGLGHFHDSVDELEFALAYLRRYKKEKEKRHE